jgi:hypothetical protein
MGDAPAVTTRGFPCPTIREELAGDSDVKCVGAEGENVAIQLAGAKRRHGLLKIGDQVAGFLEPDIQPH